MIEVGEYLVCLEKQEALLCLLGHRVCIEGTGKVKVVLRRALSDRVFDRSSE